jgi:lysozyme
MARRINQAGLRLLMASEGCVLTAYPDPGSGGAPWTIGFGHCGPEVVPGLRITRDEADRLLMEDLAKFEKAVDDLVKVEIGENQRSAVICFVYNVGVNAFKRSTLLKLMNQRDMAGASRQFSLWTKAGKRVLPGLVMRRRNEAALFMRPDRG